MGQLASECFSPTALALGSSALLASEQIGEGSGAEVRSGFRVPAGCGAGSAVGCGAGSGAGARFWRVPERFGAGDPERGCGLAG